jgi:hypothetical protein
VAGGSRAACEKDSGDIHAARPGRVSLLRYLLGIAVAGLEPVPSKAARNERKKLAAAFMNNLAVGIAVGGAFLPLFALFNRYMTGLPERSPSIWEMADIVYRHRNAVIASAVVFIGSVLMARFCRSAANHILDGLED